MDSEFQNNSILIATDFDLDAFSRSGLTPKLYYGGWIINREPYKPQELIEDINNQGIDILIVEEDKVPKIIFENCPDLKIVISMRGNPVNIDLEAAKESGVPVLYAPGRNAQAVAELTICLMLDLLRKTSDSFLDMKKGNWGKGKEDPYLRFRGKELQSSTVGLVGFGAIGQAVANLLNGFSSEVLAFDPYQTQDVFTHYCVSTVELDDLLRMSDLISIHVPLNPGTEDLLAERELSLIRPESFIINTARARIINQQALSQALIEKRIAGAALDVHYKEPHVIDDPLFKMDNVLFTPHIGGATQEVITRGSKIVIDDLVRYIQGDIPRWAAVLPK